MFSRYGSNCWVPLFWVAVFAAVGAGLSEGNPTAAQEDREEGAVHYLDQGWSADLRQRFYYTPQGSRMIPYDWFMALERPDGEGLFADTANLARYGFIPADMPTDLNPDGLPIGFAIDRADDPAYGRFLGLTCAACHTSNVTVDGTVVRIDGGAAALDFDRFYADMATAVTRTFFDPEVFQRFAGRVLETPTEQAAAQLRQRLALFETRMSGEAAIRRPALASGFGRVDALTQIVNALAVTAQGEPANLRPAAAPTSYPSLWLTPQLEFVQWNPIASSPIGRNAGEVTGVFAETTLTGPMEDWFRSSSLLRDLHDMERWVADLHPPAWDETLMGPIDADLAAEGEALFDRHCAACHNTPPYRMTDPADNHFGQSFIEIGRIDYRQVGTDPLYVESLMLRMVRTNAATASVNDAERIVPAARYFATVAGAIVSRAMDDLGLTPAERAEMSGYRLRPPLEEGGDPRPYIPPSFSDLKAGPLAGIWATGPYLHNGSVPTVYALLSPEDERPEVFWTGAREIDRRFLGFVSLHAPGRFRFDTSLPGNWNTGHLYPAEGLTHDERMAIIEYLKTL